MNWVFSHASCVVCHGGPTYALRGPIQIKSASALSGSHGRVLAKCGQRWQFNVMAVQITIRNVSEKARDELAARAALRGQSMQEFLRAELERLAARPSLEAWLQQVRKRKGATRGRVAAKRIVEHRSADRR